MHIFHAIPRHLLHLLSWLTSVKHASGDLNSRKTWTKYKFKNYSTKINLLSVSVIIRHQTHQQLDRKNHSSNTVRGNSRRQCTNLQYWRHNLLVWEYHRHEEMKGHMKTRSWAPQVHCNSSMTLINRIHTSALHTCM